MTVKAWLFEKCMSPYFRRARTMRLPLSHFLLGKSACRLAHPTSSAAVPRPTQRGAAHTPGALHIPPPLLRPLPGTARADPLAGQWQLYACISSHTGGWRPVWLCGISCRRREVTGNGQSGSGLVLCSSEYVTLHTSTKNHRLRAVSSRAARMILPASA